MRAFRNATSLALCAMAALALAPGSAVAAEQGEVGGPPTIDVQSPVRDDLVRSKPIVVAAGARRGSGRIEIVAQAFKGGLCINIARVKFFEVSGSCGDRRNRPSGLIAFNFSAYSDRFGKFHTDHGGFVSPDANSVTATYAHDGKRKAVLAMLAKPSPEILARLHQRPFAYFVAPFPACVPGGQVHASAFSLDGTALGSARGFNLGNPCD